MKTYAIRGTIATSLGTISSGQLEVEDGTITYVGSKRGYGGEILNYRDDLVCSGFIDIHVHGGAGVDVMDPEPESLRKLSAYLAVGGVTGFLATTHSASVEELERALGRIKAAKDANLPGARVLGAHLEGPFISREKVGAQDSGNLRLATVRELETLDKASGGALKIVTMAPEMQGALLAADWLSKRGFVVAAGHTDATYGECMLAFDGGFTHLSHFYNSMRGVSSQGTRYHWCRSHG